jgi:hypothetical protein
MNNNDELANTPIAHYHRPDGITCSLVEMISPTQNHERAAAWLHVFHRTSGIPLTSCYPVETDIPGQPNRARAYMLDLTRITGAERARLIAHIVKTLNVAAHIVDEGLDREGWPILATDVTVSIPMHLLA